MLQGTLQLGTYLPDPGRGQRFAAGQAMHLIRTAVPEGIVVFVLTHAGAEHGERMSKRVLRSAGNARVGGEGNRHEPRHDPPPHPDPAAHRRFYLSGGLGLILLLVLILLPMDGAALARAATANVPGARRCRSRWSRPTGRSRGSCRGGGILLPQPVGMVSMAGRVLQSVLVGIDHLAAFAGVAAQHGPG
jgi:hypothetical protein